ncbi:hypothetical protein LSH36_191g04088 [Paralvinella palmiformis]|uniref:Uncharacterized protein n=1 Tax=Paralvinella palmiformis TaxID=53620 RepID=A0AAD9JRW6_9ANNE|nr:hypothetical protein LSH36_191g04088 [Paralvinella palmiformis]
MTSSITNSFLILHAGCESQGYCHFPPYLWRSISNGDGRRPDPEAPYRKWYSRTEYVRNTETWERQKEIEARPTEIVIHHRLYASCSGYDVAAKVPCYRQTKKTRFICVAHEPEGKFRVQHLSEDGPPTFTCLRFEKRTDFIVQVYFAVRSMINVDKLCYDVALQRDEWPWIDIHGPVIPCPLVGGFDFRSYTGDSRIGTESRVATFLAETCVMSHQSLSRQEKTKSESPTAVEFGCKTPKSDHDSSENV